MTTDLHQVETDSQPPNLITPTNIPSCNSKNKINCTRRCKKLVTPNRAFAAEFARPGDEEYNQIQNPKSTPKSNAKITSLEELQRAQNKIHASELTKFMWRQVETHEETEREGRLFETEGDVYKWVRSNLKISILYQQSLSSRMKTAGSKNCTLCKKEKLHIYYNMNHPTKGKKLLNKRPELMTPCNCTTSFLRLVDLFERKRGADEVT